MELGNKVWNQSYVYLQDFGLRGCTKLFTTSLLWYLNIPDLCVSPPTYPHGNIQDLRIDLFRTLGNECCDSYGSYQVEVI